MSTIQNQMDGGNSLWVRLKDPEADGVLWIGGPDSMNVIHSQCGYHLVVGKGLLTDAKTLEAEFQSELPDGTAASAITTAFGEAYIAALDSLFVMNDGEPPTAQQVLDEFHKWFMKTTEQ